VPAEPQVFGAGVGDLSVSVPAEGAGVASGAGQDLAAVQPQAVPVAPQPATPVEQPISVVQPQPAAFAPQPVVSPAGQQQLGPQQVVPVGIAALPAEKKTKKGLLIGLIAGGVVLLAGVACLLFFVVFGGKTELACSGSGSLSGLDVQVEASAKGSSKKVESMKMNITIDAKSAQAAEMMKSSMKLMLGSLSAGMDNAESSVEVSGTKVIVRVEGDAPANSEDSTMEEFEKFAATSIGSTFGATMTCR
jgi:hypothetical protein